mmetsp:Transcript_13344/g.38466  ORF Transcript_13344/g.38466 Transcript_13344/m.38466 type:complete len:221 (+) Transcript_13344:494-1156(+)
MNHSGKTLLQNRQNLVGLLRRCLQEALDQQAPHLQQVHQAHPGPHIHCALHTQMDEPVAEGLLGGVCVGIVLGEQLEQCVWGPLGDEVEGVEHLALHLALLSTHLGRPVRQLLPHTIMHVEKPRRDALEESLSRHLGIADQRGGNVADEDGQVVDFLQAEIVLGVEECEHRRQRGHQEPPTHEGHHPPAKEERVPADTGEAAEELHGGGDAIEGRPPHLV